ncbi:MAG: anaerobic ribonucleoside-triphosphate reductase activating protein [Eggerthellaceae bacterium]|nr:anaerobic ribonucleoside-triphosphate reductase activating protein [Eggerthellaceae bacterium]
MNYSALKYNDVSNGEGIRTSLFVSGCRHACKGCFNREAWDFTAGKPFTQAVAEDILASLQPPYIRGLSILGGEPLEPENQAVLLPFFSQVKATFPKKTIWLYTGDILEDLLDTSYSRHTDDTASLLSYIDVLVDGLFEEEKKDITLRFRGSSNQRIIDLPQTLAHGKVFLWNDKGLYSRETKFPGLD